MPKHASRRLNGLSLSSPCSLTQETMVQMCFASHSHTDGKIRLRWCQLQGCPMIRFKRFTIVGEVKTVSALKPQNQWQRRDIVCVRS
jgi:hypothetical protein